MAETKAFTLRPTNDPTRPCWGLLGDILGRKLEVPADAATAATALRGYLREAFSTQSERALAMMLGSGAGKDMLVSFAKIHREGGSARIRSESRDGEMFSDPRFRSAAQYLVSHLFNMDMGRGSDYVRLVSKVQAYRDLDTSTREPINSWLPEKCGVAPYIRARVRHILLEYYERLEVGRGALSLDRCQESGREISTNREFVVNRHGSSVDDERAAFDPNAERNVEFDPSATAHEGAAPADEAPDEGEEDGVDVPDTEDAVARDLRAFQADSPMGDSAREAVDQRLEALVRQPDDVLRAFIPLYPDPKVDPVAGARAAAAELLDKLCKLDSQLAEDREPIGEVIKEWDGVTALRKFIPEIHEAALKLRYVLAGAVKSASLKNAPSEKEAAIVDQTMEMFALDEKPAKGRANRVPGFHAAAATAEADVNFDIMLDAAVADVDMTSTDRPDYIFLCNAVGVQPNWDLEEGALYDELTRLGGLYLDHAGSYQREHVAYADWVKARIDRWNPRLALFTDGLRAIVGQMVYAGGPKQPRKKGKAVQVGIEID